MNSASRRPRVLLTRPAEDNRAWAEELERLGYQPLSFPCLSTRTLPEGRAALVEGFAECAWLVLTSRRGAQAVHELSGELDWGAKSIACVGESTAKVARLRLGQADLTASGGTAADLARDLRVRLTPGDRVLAAGAREAREDLEAILGAEHVLRAAVYETRISSEAGSPPPHEAVLFASPTAVAGYFAATGGPPPGTAGVALGPTTFAALQARAWSPRIEARERSLRAMVEALEQLQPGDVA